MTTPALALILWLAADGAAVADDSLADLIQAGDRDAALQVIREGADVNAAQGDGTTPLHWAVYKIDAELVAELVERGARPDVINNYGSSPLAEAVKIGELSLVEMLLDAGADLEAPNQDGQTVLMLAARAGALEVAELLVARGANVNTRETWRGQTAVMWAADGGFADIVELLIAHGADVHVRALANEWEAQITSEPRAQYRPTGGLTALLYAARSGCRRCVEVILDAGAGIDHPNPDGVTPLMVALDNSRFDTAQALLERGANPHTWDWWGRTPLYVAVDMNSYRARPGTEPVEAGDATGLDLIRLLLAAGVNPNAQLNMHRPSRGGNIGRFADDLLTTGATPLLRAASSHDRAAVVALLEHGALVDLPNVMGVTPLMAAAGVGVRRLSIGGEVELGGDVESRAIATLEVLLAAGADVNARIVEDYGRTGRIARASQMTEREGQTALYGAVKFGWARVVAYLIERGASVDIVDAHGRSPIDAALGTTGGRDNVVSPEIAEMLEKARKPAG
jgi:ankyrin repeat protein